MNYLSVESVSKSYGVRKLFSDISFGINKGQKVAIVAKNGAGKSSLLNIISGMDAPDSGNVTFRKDISVAFLEQNPHLDENASVMETVFTGNTPTLKAIKEYERCVLAQQEAPTDDNLKKLEKANEQMNLLDAWDYETRIRQVLSQLNIHDLKQNVGRLSGGQKKRVALSRVLIDQPDLLIMDEPTNHLDVEMIEWLEEYLMGRDITLLLVTHDRYFLDRVCTQIIELENGQLYHYNGNFSYYVEKKAEREMMEASEMEKTRNIYRRELEWVRKMPRARTVKSKARVDAFSDIEEKATARRIEDKLELNVKMTRIGGKILELIKVSKSYGDFPILKSFSYIFKKNEKIGIVGRNGVGKTTLLNMIMQLEKPDTGKIQTGETIVFGYYSQEGLKLNDDKRVIEVVKSIAEYIPLADGSKLSASQLLQRFQFPPDMQYNFVSKLSGGEKRRLYLLTVLIKNPNFLILDEPTNDLDILTLGILEEFLTEFQGCVLIVTHDRYFMDKLVDHLFVFEGGGNVKDFPGNYTDYRNWQDKQKKEVRTEVKEIKKEPVKAQPAETNKKKLSYKEKFELEQLEKELPLLEAEKKDLEDKLSGESVPHADILKWSVQLEKVLKELDTKSTRWLELSA